MTMTAPMIQPGQILEGKFRIERVLGEGGMGVVVAATHLDLDQLCAIKFLLPHALEHPQIVERFLREGRAASRVTSLHVARVIDVGRMKDGTPFMIMEYLDGEDLEHALVRRGPLPIGDAVGYILEACEAMAEAHVSGIVHRDLKPANLFLAKQKNRRVIVKVLDFGISKLTDGTTTNLTKTSTAMGTPYYMSPEQLMNAKSVDARSDIWSIGIILYELLSGVRPFEADSMPEIVAKILGNQPLRLNNLRPDIPLELEAVIFKCFASKPEDRYASVAELAEALAPFAEESSQASVGIITRTLGGTSDRPPPNRATSTVAEFSQTGPNGAGNASAAAAAVAEVVADVDSAHQAGTQISGSSRAAGAGPPNVDVAQAQNAGLGSTQLAADSARTRTTPTKRTNVGAMLAAAAAVCVVSGVAYMKLGKGPSVQPDPNDRQTIDIATSTPTAPVTAVTAVTTPVPSTIVAITTTAAPTATSLPSALAVPTSRPGTHAIVQPILPKPTATAQPVKPPGGDPPTNIMNMGIK